MKFIFSRWPQIKLFKAHESRNENRPYRPEPLYRLTVALKNGLDSVDELIVANLNVEEGLIRSIAETLVRSGGKRLRPLFCLASAAIAEKITENSIYIAAAVELIHAATLLHDDVIDESSLRRGVPTANVTWGNKPSILVGDFLFARAFELMVKTGDIRFLDILASASAKISEGEIAQLRLARSLDVSVQDYLALIEKKTAILFGVSCETGALAAGADTGLAKELGLYGLYFGIMYQAMDDIHDYANGDRGKAIGDDFKERKVTLPVLLAFRDDPDKRFWREIFSIENKNPNEWQNEWKAVNDKLDKFDSLRKSEEIAFLYARKAKERLSAVNHPYAGWLGELTERFGLKLP